MDLKELGRKIKILRSEAGITQREMAEKIGTTAASLSAYENGTQNPSVSVIVAIADLFQVNTDWLCGRTRQANRFHTDAIVRFDLHNALYSLLELIRWNFLSIENTELLEELGHIDASSLVVNDGNLEQFIKDALTLDDLRANCSISEESYDVCLDEMVYRLSKEIHDSREYDIERRKKELAQEISDRGGLPF